MSASVGPPVGTRICVIGNAAAGKTFLARTLAARFGLRYIDFDAMVVGPNWQRVPRADRVHLFDTATRNDRWAIDGHLRSDRPEEQLLLERADTVVWLDFTRWGIMTSVIPRTLSNTIRRKPLWNGNTETWPMLFSRDHSIIGAWQMHARLRDDYERLFADPANASRQLIRLRTRGQVNAWLADVTSA